MGCFLFLGPTGVGKTEVARRLAEFLMGSEKALVRFDMSEYMEKHSVSKLIGAPPGYVGYEEGGQLTERVRRSPYSIILLDEIEKAHPDVYNILPQVFEDGQLSDGLGNTVDFRNAILIMTSNLGARYLQKRSTMGFQSAADDTNDQKMEDLVMTEVRRLFNPEFLNRLDEILVFRRLSRTDMKGIVAIQLVRLQKLLADRKITLVVDNKAREWLAEIGYDPVYGARPLKRVIQRELQNPLAEQILAGRIADGETVKVTTSGEDRLKILGTVAKAAE